MNKGKINNALDVMGTLTGMDAFFTSTVTSNVPTTSIVDPKHLTTKEYVDLKAVGTDLTKTRSRTFILLQSSTGDDVYIYSASSNYAGILTADDKFKLDSIDVDNLAYTNVDNDFVAQTINTSVTVENSSNPQLILTTNGTSRGIIGADTNGEVFIEGTGTGVSIMGDYTGNMRFKAEYNKLSLIGLSAKTTETEVVYIDSNGKLSKGAVSGGTSDHSSLSNLDYASAGHTGFAGTGVSNTFTENQTISKDDLFFVLKGTNNNAYARWYANATEAGRIFTAGTEFSVLGNTAWGVNFGTIGGVTRMNVGEDYIKMYSLPARTSETDVLYIGSDNILYKGPSSGVSFGSDKQIPFTNSAGDGFNYTSDLTWDSVGKELIAENIKVNDELTVSNIFCSSGTGITLFSNYVRMTNTLIAYRKSSAPSGIIDGAMYYDTTAKTLYVYANGSWKDALASGGAADNWGSQVVESDSTLTGNGTTGSLLGVADNSIEEVKLKISNTPTNGYYLQYKDSTNKLTWAAVSSGGAGDDWGAQVVESDSTLTGDGTSSSLLGVANLGITHAKIALEAVEEDNLKISNAPTDGYYLQYKNGTDKLTWAAGAAGGVGDDWGAQVVESNSSLTGDGTSSSLLSIATAGVSGSHIANSAITNEKISNDTIEEEKLKISNSPTNGYYLQYKDSTNKLTWAAVSSGSTPGGNNRSIQYNDNGNFDGFGSWSSNILTIPGSIYSSLGNITVASGVLDFGNISAPSSIAANEGAVFVSDASDLDDTLFYINSTKTYNLLEIENTYQNLGTISSNSYTANYRLGKKMYFTIGATVNFTIANVPNGGAGTLYSTTSNSGRELNVLGSTGYTTVVLIGAHEKSDIRSGKTTIISYERIGSTLYVGYTYEYY